MRRRTNAHGDDVALSAQSAATSASSTRRFRFPSFTSQNCGYVLTNCDSWLFVISIEDLLVGISIKLQYTPEKRRYSNFDLLVALNLNFDKILQTFSFLPPPRKKCEASKSAKRALWLQGTLSRTGIVTS